MTMQNGFFEVPNLMTEVMTSLESQVSNLRTELDMLKEAHKGTNVPKVNESAHTIHPTHSPTAATILSSTNLPLNEAHKKKDFVIKFFKDKLCIDPPVVSVIPLGKPSKEKRVPYLVKLESPYEKGKIFLNCYRLAGAKISITDDFTPEPRASRRQLMPTLKELKTTGNKVHFRGGSLYFNGEPYSA